MKFFINGRHKAEFDGATLDYLRDLIERDNRKRTENMKDRAAGFLAKAERVA